MTPAVLVALDAPAVLMVDDQEAGAVVVDEEPRHGESVGLADPQTAQPQQPQHQLMDDVQVGGDLDAVGDRHELHVLSRFVVGNDAQHAGVIRCGGVEQAGVCDDLAQNPQIVLDRQRCIGFPDREARVRGLRLEAGHCAQPVLDELTTSDHVKLEKVAEAGQDVQLHVAPHVVAAPCARAAQFLVVLVVPDGRNLQQAQPVTRRRRCRRRPSCRPGDDPVAFGQLCRQTTLQPLDLLADPALRLGFGRKRCLKTTAAAVTAWDARVPGVVAQSDRACEFARHHATSTVCVKSPLWAHGVSALVLVPLRGVVAIIVLPVSSCGDGASGASTRNTHTRKRWGGAHDGKERCGHHHPHLTTHDPVDADIGHRQTSTTSQPPHPALCAAAPSTRRSAVINIADASVLGRSTVIDGGDSVSNVGPGCAAAHALHIHTTIRG